MLLGHAAILAYKKENRLQLSSSNIQIEFQD